MQWYLVLVCLHENRIWHDLFNSSTVYWTATQGMVLERTAQSFQPKLMHQYTTCCLDWSKNYCGILTMAIVLKINSLAGQGKAGRWLSWVSFAITEQFSRAALQQVDIVVERHDHLQISLDWLVYQIPHIVALHAIPFLASMIFECKEQLPLVGLHGCTSLQISSPYDVVQQWYNK